MNDLWKAITLGLLTSLLGIAVSFTHYGIDLEENFGLAWLFKLRGERQAPPEAVVISLDKESADHLNLPQDVRRWPRSYHAHLIQRLVNQGASVIVFDLSFKYEGEGDDLLAKAIRKARNVVLAEHIAKEAITSKDQSGQNTGEIIIEKVLPPIPVLAQEAVASAPFVLPKVPIRVNQFWTFTGDSEDFPTIPVVAFQIFALQVYDDLVGLIRKALNRPEIAQAKLDRANRSALTIAQRLTALNDEEIIADKKVHELISSLKDLLGKRTLISEVMVEELENPEQPYPDAQRAKILKALIKMYKSGDSHYLNFYGPPQTITTMPYWQVLEPPSKVLTHPKSVDFKGKVVFIGSSEISIYEQKDGFYTVFSQPNGIDLSGVEICASAFANLLEDFPVRPLDFQVHLLTLLIWGIAIGMIGFLLPPVLATVSSVGLVLLYASIAYHQFKIAGTWFPLIIPIFLQMPFASFGAVLWKYFDTNRERMVIRKAFGHYVPDEVVDRLSKSLGSLRTDGQSVYGTCLYTDIENYTSLSETLSPEALRVLMNDYYEAIFSPVNQHEGIVLEVKGDSMLAIWATADPDPRLRARACFAAIDVIHAVDQFNQSSGRPKLHTRIGLHSGKMLIGNIGGGTHYEYTAIGDIINTASRIEGLSKLLGTRLLASSEVLVDLKDFLTRELGKFLLRGKSKPLVVYEVVACATDCDSDQERLCKNFSAALDLFRIQRWAEARGKLEEILSENVADGPSCFYLNLCKDFKENPPWEGWDGIIRISKT